MCPQTHLALEAPTLSKTEFKDGRLERTQLAVLGCAVITVTVVAVAIAAL